ncbi:MAG: hypothetical protein ABH919_02665 [bacterium]
MKNAQKIDKAIKTYASNECGRNVREEILENLEIDMKRHNIFPLSSQEISRRREEIKKERKYDLVKICLAVIGGKTNKGSVAEEIKQLIKFVPNWEEMGVSKKGLDRLKRKGAEKEATNLLEEIRSKANKTTVERELNRLIYIAKAESISLKEIKTSREELEALLKKGYRKQALGCLRQAKEKIDSKDIGPDIETIEDLAKQKKITLRRIRTSKEELYSLIKQNCKHVATHRLGVARSLKRHNDKPAAKQVFSEVKELLSTAKLGPELIGTTEEELDQFEKKSFWEQF